MGVCVVFIFCKCFGLFHFMPLSSGWIVAESESQVVYAKRVEKGDVGMHCAVEPVGAGSQDYRGAPPLVIPP